MTNFAFFSLQHLKELTEKQDREKAEREAQALRRRSGAASPILEVMRKEMDVTKTTTAAQSTSTTDEATRTPRDSGRMPSTSRTESADPEKAGKELLVSTFSAAVWGTHYNNNQRPQKTV